LWSSRPSLWLAVSSVADITIAMILAVGGIAMAPLPASMVGAALVAAILFTFILDVVKVPVFRRRNIT
jgi:H+-transporting ATPase